MTSYVDIDEDINIQLDVQKIMDDLLVTVMDHENCPYEACVNLLVTNSEQVHELNLIHRKIDNTTDVLSFPALEFEVPGDFGMADEAVSDSFDPETGELILGDIVINIDRVFSQAQEYGHSVYREFAFLIAHSLFHLCGYDHMVDDEARVMELYQEEVLETLGIVRE